MIINRLGDQLRDQNWISILIELFVVVIGILLAFWIDEWRQESQNRTIEQQYLQEILDDLETDRGNLERSIGQRQQRLPAIREILAVLSDPNASQEEATRLLELEKLALEGSVASYVPATTTFDKMQTAGDLKVVRDDDLYRELVEYYALRANQLSTLNAVESWLAPWRQLSMRLYGALSFVQESDVSGTPRLLNEKYKPPGEQIIARTFDVASRRNDLGYLNYLGDMYQQQSFFEVRWTEHLAINHVLKDRISAYLADR